MNVLEEETKTSPSTVFDFISQSVEKMVYGELIDETKDSEAESDVLMKTILHRKIQLIALALTNISSPVSTTITVVERISGTIINDEKTKSEYKNISLKEEQEKQKDVVTDDETKSNRHGSVLSSARIMEKSWQNLIEKHPHEVYISLPNITILKHIEVEEGDVSETFRLPGNNIEKVFYLVFNNISNDTTSELKTKFMGITPIFGPSAEFYRVPSQQPNNSEKRRNSRFFPLVDLMTLDVLKNHIIDSIDRRYNAFVCDYNSLALYQNTDGFVIEQLRREKMWIIDFTVRTKVLLETFLGLPLPSSVASICFPILSCVCCASMFHNPNSCCKRKLTSSETRCFMTDPCSREDFIKIPCNERNLTVPPRIIKIPDSSVSTCAEQPSFESLDLRLSEQITSLPIKKCLDDLKFPGPCCMYDLCTTATERGTGNIEAKILSRDSQNYPSHWFNDCSYFSSPAFIPLETPFMSVFKCGTVDLSDIEPDYSIPPQLRSNPDFNSQSPYLPPSICPVVMQEDVVQKMKVLKDLCAFNDLIDTRFNRDTLVLASVELCYGSKLSPANQFDDNCAHLFAYIDSLPDRFLVPLSFYSGCTFQTLKDVKTHESVLIDVIMRGYINDPKDVFLYQKGSLWNIRNHEDENHLFGKMKKKTLISSPKTRCQLWSVRKYPIFKSEYDNTFRSKIASVNNDEGPFIYSSTMTPHEHERYRTSIRSQRDILYTGLVSTLFNHKPPVRDEDITQKTSRNGNFCSPNLKQAKSVKSCSTSSDLLSGHLAHLTMVFLYGSFRHDLGLHKERLPYLYQDQKRTYNEDNSTGSDGSEDDKSTSSDEDDKSEDDNEFLKTILNINSEIGKTGAIASPGYFWPNMEKSLIDNLLFQLHSSEMTFCIGREVPDLVSLSRFRSHMFIQNDLLQPVINIYIESLCEKDIHFMTFTNPSSERLVSSKTVKKYSTLSRLSQKVDALFSGYENMGILTSVNTVKDMNIDKLVPLLTLRRETIVRNMDSWKVYFNTSVPSKGVLKAIRVSEIYRTAAKTYISDSIVSQAKELDVAFAIISANQYMREYQNLRMKHLHEKDIEMTKPNDKYIFTSSRRTSKKPFLSNDDHLLTDKRSLVDSPSSPIFKSADTGLIFGEFEHESEEKCKSSSSSIPPNSPNMTITDEEDEMDMCEKICVNHSSEIKGKTPWIKIPLGLRSELGKIYGKLPHEFCYSPVDWLSIIDEIDSVIKYSLTGMKSYPFYVLLSFIRHMILLELKDGGLRALKVITRTFKI